MAKELILLNNVPGLGAEGDVVEVAEGYARNYLLPQKMAAQVTEVTKNRMEKLKADRLAREGSELQDARKLAQKLEQVSCTIPVKTGEDGRMFGSVTVAHILDTINEQGFKLSKKQVALDETIRETGVFNIDVKLHPEVSSSVKVWVVEE